MKGGGWPQWLGDLTSVALEGRGRGGGSLKIALINNMPDKALQATERQFSALLSAASPGAGVDVRFYSLHGVKRSEIVQAHINSSYEDIGAFFEDPPDGVIMTGTNPNVRQLEEEAFWPAMASVINFCHENEIPGVWSCLAAHAAVLEIDGVRRRQLGRKLSGVFECRIDTRKHQIFHRMPGRWRVPHSRYNGLQRRDLERNGYDVVSGSAAAGVDMFIKRYSCIQLFLQGHPEYDPTSLMEEFQREIVHALRDNTAPMPEIPSGLYARARGIGLPALRAAFKARKEDQVVACLETMLSHRAPTPRWANNARTLFENWLAYVEARKNSAVDQQSQHNFDVL